MLLAVSVVSLPPASSSAPLWAAPYREDKDSVVSQWACVRYQGLSSLSACDILAIDKALTPVTLVLAEDGTIVDDDDYFLCLPSNTKFVALASNEKWIYSNSGRSPEPSAAGSPPQTQLSHGELAAQALTQGSLPRAQSWK